MSNSSNSMVTLKRKLLMSLSSWKILVKSLVLLIFWFVFCHSQWLCLRLFAEWVHFVHSLQLLYDILNPAHYVIMSYQYLNKKVCYQYVLITKTWDKYISVFLSINKLLTSVSVYVLKSHFLPTIRWRLYKTAYDAPGSRDWPLNENQNT